MEREPAKGSPCNLPHLSFVLTILFILMGSYNSIHDTRVLVNFIFFVSTNLYFMCRLIKAPCKEVNSVAVFTSDLSWVIINISISLCDKRTVRPYSNFPNLVVIYPQFSEEEFWDCF